MTKISQFFGLYINLLGELLKIGGFSIIQRSPYGQSQGQGQFWIKYLLKWNILPTNELNLSILLMYIFFIFWVVTGESVSNAFYLYDGKIF